MEASALPRSRVSVLPRSRRLLTAFSDERLVEQIRRGNDAAFEVVFDRHHRAILSFCRHMLGSQDEAEDAVQQTFASAFSALAEDDREIRLKAWLYAIARNKSLSILRARREQPAELDERVATAGLSEEVQQRADLRELLADLRELPDDQREALVLFELGDLSHADIAGVIGVEPMKVKALVFQARSALIENREARAIPCVEIRERLANGSGGELRRGPLRRHLKSCEGCAEYRDMVKKQRRAMAALLPVIPTAGLKAGVLGTLGIGGGAGGAGITSAAGGTLAGGGAVAGGGAAAAGGGFASMGAAKLAVSAIIATGAVAGGGFAVERAIHHDSSTPPTASEAAASDPGTSVGNGSAPGEPTAGQPISNTGGSEPSGGGGAGSGSGDPGDKNSDGDSKGGDDDRGDSRDRDGKKNGRRGGASDGRRNEGRGSQQESREDDDESRGRDDDDGDGDGNRGHGNDEDGDDEDNPGRGRGNGNSGGNGNGNGRDDGKKDDRKGGQTAPPAPPAPTPPPVADTGDESVDDDDDKDDAKDRLTVVTQLGEAAARP